MIGIVLAGGKSQRFGSPKAFEKMDGKFFYQYSLDALSPEVDSIFMVTSPELEKLFPANGKKFDIIKDRKDYQGQGPLAGIYTVMERAIAKWYIVIPIDVPFMNHLIIEKLIMNLQQDVDAVIPVISGRVQPLIAIYHYSVKELIKQHLDNGNRSVKAVIEQLNVRYVEMEEEQPFFNINHKTDYEKWVGNKRNSE